MYFFDINLILFSKMKIIWFYSSFQGSANFTACGPGPASCLFCKLSFYWDIAICMCLDIVCGCFFGGIVELSIWNRDPYGLQSVKYYLALNRKS